MLQLEVPLSILPSIGCVPGSRIFSVSCLSQPQAHVGLGLWTIVGREQNLAKPRAPEPEHG